eukprot:g16589.t1
MEKGSDPKVFFADILSREMNLKAIGVEIPEAEMVQLILRQLSDDFDVEKRTLFVTDPEISRVVLEQRISAAYSVRKANSLGKQPTAAAPAAATDSAAKSNPHALAVGQGDGFRQGGHGGFGRHPGGGGGNWGRGPPSSAQQQQWSRGGGASQQQQWSRGGGAPQQQQWSRGGGAPQQQQWSRGGGSPQQQQQWSRGGGAPQQQQWRPPWNPSDFMTAYRDWYTMYASWQKDWQQQQQQRSGPPAPHGPPTSPRRSAMSPPPPPPPPNSHVRPPRNSSGKFNRGVGGIYDCGRNADYFQTESPPPPGKPMGWVHQCQRCGRLGHEAADCDAIRRFEGYCDICGDYGHSASRCRFRRRKSGGSLGGYAYANVVSVPDAERPSTPVPVAAPGGFVDDRGYFTPDPCGGPGSAPLRNAGGDGGGEETSVGPVEQQSEPASEERRVTFQEDPVADEGGVVYEEEDPGEWNAAVEAQNRGEDPFGQHFAAALSLPYGAATAGRDGDVFHPGFMALRPVSEGPCVDEGSDGPSVDNEVRGGSSGAKEPAPTDGDSGREAAVPGTADREAESGGSLGPPSLPPEMEWVPPLVHQSPDEQLPPGAKLYKGRVYRAEPRQTRAQTRAASAAAATAGGASDAATTGERYALVDRVGITAALVLQFGGVVLPETKERCEEAETKERCEEVRTTRRTPGMFTIRRSQEDILRAVYDEPAPDISPDDLPAVPVHELAAPLTVEEALSGPYAKLWKHAMRGELGGHLDTGTFEQLDANS